VQADWTPAPPALKGEWTEPSVHTTTSDVGKLRRKSAAVSDQPGSEQEQPSMKVFIVQFGGVQGGADGHKISFSLGVWFSCDEQEGLFNLGCTEREVSCCRKKLSAGRRRAHS